MTNELRVTDTAQRRRRALRLLVVAATLGLASAAVAASGCSARSGPGLVPLIELYTSEGCDSCPPADRWLSARFPPARASADASVLAFHVDYWDRLGWKDRFASPSYTERQYATMRASGATFVYTPQVVVQGRDLPGWQRGAVEGRLASARGQPARAAIALDVEPEADGRFALRAEARVAPSSSRPNARLWLAYAESGLVSDVTAGENRGVRLAHDHVVRALHGPFPVDADGNARAVIAQAPQAERGATAAVVAFVQDARSGDVLQSLTIAGCAER
jgi:hypothetical protein